jgi:hypothetical protein
VATASFYSTNRLAIDMPRETRGIATHLPKVRVQIWSTRSNDAQKTSATVCEFHDCAAFEVVSLSKKPMKRSETNACDQKIRGYRKKTPYPSYVGMTFA